MTDLHKIAVERISHFRRRNEELAFCCLHETEAARIYLNVPARVSVRLAPRFRRMGSCTRTG